MRFSSLLIGLLPLVSALPDPRYSSHEKPPFFVLAGDSTTAVQSAGGGGWGDGFLSLLTRGAAGVNLGHNGATTVSFVAGGDWNNSLAYARNHSKHYDVYVTIQFGHNDQKNTSGITLEEYETNLENLALDVKRVGATPILVTSLSRRNFNTSTTPPTIIQDLETQRELTIEAAKNTHSKYIDLNLASVAYLNAIGPTLSDTYNLHGTDHTHLNTQGSLVFGIIVANLITRKGGPYPELRKYFDLDPRVVYDLTHGIYWYPATCSGDFCGSE